MKNLNLFPVLALAGIAMFQLAGCGGGGSSGGDTGLLSASITDAAVDDMEAVNLRVIALQLRLEGAGETDWVSVDVRDESGGALEFNLLDYQHGATFPLFEDERVPAGVYEHARLVLEAPAGTPGECIGQDPLEGSHVIVRDTQALVPLFIPSGADTGVKLASPFRVPVDGFAAIVIDFDLRQALHQPPAFRDGCYFLRPAFRVEAVQNTGRIAGTVALPLLDGRSGLCSDNDPTTGNAVYVYEGWNQVPGDINADETVPTAAPFATSAVMFDAAGGGEGSYAVAFLPPGDYTVAFTCRADDERLPDPDAVDEDERLAVDELDFQQPQNAVVEAQVTTVVNFAAD
ncbi:DUF4382 domain-containing protein [Thioalkalivibrio paradoxus]|uniref:DUF4382 domain-containing protein n=1 Tax=Thioalkalivibrio paradoxus ARh 1 TaxID=713585 RepID=W0DN36_9GAMM|nr:DUF4382 domain-containing protein [Thioalkalivibrio paradoxus]AHE99866.1 hypothetical protein THITH_01960 [Thioalkalivibrio paradoxus ARh 1]